MASRTRKWSFVEQEAKRLIALKLSEREIAKRLNVNKSTITRWKKAGKLQKASESIDALPVDPPPARISPAEWSRSVRAEYQLDSTDEALVTLAEAALSASRDMTASLREQLSAGARFAALVRQMNLPGRRIAALADQQPAPPVAKEPEQRKTNPVVQRSTVDPRTAFTVIK